LRRLTTHDLQYFKSLNIDTKSKYFRSHYKKGLLNEIDEDFINDIQEYYQKHYNHKIDPITHIAFANLTKNKDVRIIPQLFYRKKFLNVFNDSAMNDMFRDKGLYDILIDTDQKAYNVLKYTRGQYVTNINEFIDENKALDILFNDSEEYILKPSDTNNGIGITKLKVRGNKLFIDDREITLKDLKLQYGYNYLIQRVIKQHDTMAKPHPNSVNTLRMATFRWKGKIHNLYTFARFGHSGNIKDNAGAGGLVVGVKNDGTFMDYGVVRSKIVHEHPTTNIRITEFGRVPNMSEVNKFVRELHENILLQNYVAWDIAINQDGKPIFIENNFYGGSWINQVALNQSMFGDLTDEILQFISKNESKMVDINLKSISARRKQNINQLKRRRSRDKERIKSLENQLESKDKQVNTLKEEIYKIKNSRYWKWTSFLRRKN